MKRVYDAKDLVDAHMMAHALEAQGIRSHLRGEFESELVGEPTVWIVDDENHEKATSIVAGIIEANRIREEPRERPARRQAGLGTGILMGFVLGAAAFSVLYALDIPPGIRPPSRWDSNDDGMVDTWVEREGKGIFSYAYDNNFDGRPDAWYYYRNYRLERALYDENFDGKPDGWAFFDARGLRELAEEDLDFDGRVDFWAFYKDGQRVEEAFDNDRDGKKDEWTRLQHARPLERTWSYLEDGIIDKKAIYRNGRKVEELYDRNRDGKFDESVALDEFERVVRRTRL